jgi:hypothetical protein
MVFSFDIGTTGCGAWQVRIACNGSMLKKKTPYA